MKKMISVLLVAGAMLPVAAFASTTLTCVQKPLFTLNGHAYTITSCTPVVIVTPPVIHVPTVPMH